MQCCHPFLALARLSVQWWADRCLLNRCSPSGVGQMLLQAVTSNDYALMQGIFLIITVTVLVVNFIIDLLYGIIDPRTRITDCP